MNDNDIMKNTYAGLVAWVKELLEMRRVDDKVFDRNLNQARRISELEFDLRKYRYIMVEDRQETIVKEHGVIQSDVVSLEEFRKNRTKLRGGGGNPPDGKDWLSPMIWGTEFLARPKVNKTWLLAKFIMGGVKAGAVLLIPTRGDDPVTDDKDWMWVDPVEFVKYWELMSIILEPEELNE